jgi:hypothetical protein
LVARLLLLQSARLALLQLLLLHLRLFLSGHAGCCSASIRVGSVGSSSGRGRGRARWWYKRDDDSKCVFR